MGHALIRVNARLEVSIRSISAGGIKTCAVRLDRIAAQNLGDAILQLSGATAKSASLGRVVAVVGEDIDPVPVPRKAGVVRVGKVKGGPLPVVRLNTRR